VKISPLSSKHLSLCSAEFCVCPFRVLFAEWGAHFFFIEEEEEEEEEEFTNYTTQTTRTKRTKNKDFEQRKGRR
jgi:hypothetical protein